jgi:hypothetical protein
MDEVWFAEAIVLWVSRVNQTEKAADEGCPARYQKVVTQESGS